jgi:hypothetical protein
MLATAGPLSAGGIFSSSATDCGVEAFNRARIAAGDDGHVGIGARVDCGLDLADHLGCADDADADAVDDARKTRA